MTVTPNTPTHTIKMTDAEMVALVETLHTHDFDENDILRVLADMHPKPIHGDIVRDLQALIAGVVR